MEELGSEAEYVEDIRVEMASNYRCDINVPLSQKGKEIIKRPNNFRVHIKKKRAPTLKHFKKYEYTENFQEMANRLVMSWDFGLEMGVQAVIQRLKTNRKEFLLPLCLALIRNPDSIGQEIAEELMPEGIFNTAENIVNQRHFQIRSSDTGAYMFLRDLSKDEFKNGYRRWNFRLRRFTESAKYAHNYYVLAGANPSEKDRSWHVTQVKQTKYFRISHKEKLNGNADLYIPGITCRQKDRAETKYIYARQAEDLTNQNHFTIIPVDDLGEQVYFKSKVYEMMPYVCNETIKWQSNMYVFGTPS